MSPSARSLCDPLEADAELAELVAARRPTVSSAVAELSRAGLVRSVREGWLLAGEPPGAPDGAGRSAGAAASVASV